MSDWIGAALHIDAAAVCGHDVPNEQQRQAGAAHIQAVVFEQSGDCISGNPWAVVPHVKYTRAGTSSATATVSVTPASRA